MPKRHEKDFEWRPRERNPYSREPKTDGLWKMKLSLLTGLILGILFLFVYHPFFHIKKINIAGRQRINEAELGDSVRGMVDYRKFFILPGDSYFLVDAKNVEDFVRARFPVASVTVSKSFPQTLNIEITEKISTIIYDNGKQYSYLGLDGNVVEILRRVGDNEWDVTKKTTTSTLPDGTTRIVEEIADRRHVPPVADIVLEMGDYPIVYDARHKEAGINDVVLTLETVRSIIDWFNLLNNRTDIPVGYFTLEVQEGSAAIKTREGWEIKVKINGDARKQFKNLQYILKEVRVERKNLNYIDLRYQDKVYWR